MRTIELKLYQFSELSEQAKERAIQDYRESAANEDLQIMFSEYLASLKRFCDLTGVELKDYSLCDRSDVTLRFESYDFDNTDLQGLRLRTWVINNWSLVIERPKFLKVLNYKDMANNTKKMPFILKDAKTYNSYTLAYSRVQKCALDDCGLTGLYSDYAVLKPLFDFVVRPYDFRENYDLEDLLTDIAGNFEADVNNAYESILSDEYIKEHLENCDYEYLSNGELH